MMVKAWMRGIVTSLSLALLAGSAHAGALCSNYSNIRFMGANWAPVGAAQNLQIAGIDIACDTYSPPVLAYFAPGATWPIYTDSAAVTVLGDTLVSATLPAQATAGSGYVSIRTEIQPGNFYFSFGAPFYVVDPDAIAPRPVLDTVSVSSIVSGSGDTLIDLTGSGFLPAIDVGTSLWWIDLDSLELVSLTPTTLTDDSLSVLLPASLLDHKGTGLLQVRVGDRTTQFLRIELTDGTPPAPVSEPHSLGLAVLGAAALALQRRRRRLYSVVD